MSSIRRRVLLLMKAVTSFTYATLDPANKGGGITLSGGNLTGTTIATNEKVFSTIGKTSGKWYWEAQVLSGALVYLGIAELASTTSGSIGFDTASVGARSNNGSLYWNSGIVASGASFTTGDIIGFALDATAKTIAVYKNNVLQYTYTYSTGGGATYAVGGGSAGGAASFVFNFGASALVYSPPAGFNAGLYL